MTKIEFKEKFNECRKLVTIPIQAKLDAYLWIIKNCRLLALIFGAKQVLHLIVDKNGTAHLLGI